MADIGVICRRGGKKKECRNGIGRKQKGLPEVCKIQGRLKKIVLQYRKAVAGREGNCGSLAAVTPFILVCFFPLSQIEYSESMFVYGEGKEHSH